jgi:hypothetical protein
MADKRTTLANGNTLTITSVAGGSFTQVQEREPDGWLVYSRSHMFTINAERDYQTRGGK